MNLQKLAEQAVVALNEAYDWYDVHGVEIIEGFFNLYNGVQGQGRRVVFHPESGYVFKYPDVYSGVALDPSNSGRPLGTVAIDDVEYLIRFCELFVVKSGEATIEVQEYVSGSPCHCLDDAEGWHDAWCEHAYAVQTASGVEDTHTGNWKIVGREIVLFDC